MKNAHAIALLYAIMAETAPPSRSTTNGTLFFIPNICSDHNGSFSLRAVEATAIDSKSSEDQIDFSAFSQDRDDRKQSALLVLAQSKILMGF